jgi:5,10-methylenetetrahydrofolate reductase
LISGALTAVHTIGGRAGAAANLPRVHDTDISRLARVLRDGTFAVTSELGPPKHSGIDGFAETARLLAPWVDAANITDNQTAQSRMSPLAAGRIALDNGVEPVMQMTVRDRNRLALTSDLLGASALGIHNTLAMSGDPIHIGNHPDAQAVNDIDTLSLLRLQDALRAGHFANADSEPLQGPAPQLLLGATANPLAPDSDVEISKIRAKLDAGADFFQTQLCYRPERVAEFLDRLRAADLPSWPRLLIGVGPFKHLRMAIHMRDKVWGVDVPEELVGRMEAADNEGETGKQICIEIIQQLRELDGIAGCHVMAVAWERSVPEILVRAGVRSGTPPTV